MRYPLLAMVKSNRLNLGSMNQTADELHVILQRLSFQEQITNPNLILLHTNPYFLFFGDVCNIYICVATKIQFHLSYISIDCVKKVWIQKWRLGLQLNAISLYLAHPIGTPLTLNLLCPTIFYHQQILIQSVPRLELHNSGYVVYHHFHLTLQVITAKFSYSGTDWKQTPPNPNRKLTIVNK